jgi:DNA-binding Lrp family transcriptional regulator
MRADEIDDRDRAILRDLMSDGRLTSLALAERVQLSSSACLRRVRLLEERGLIAGYVMPLDPDVAGLSGEGFVSVTLEQQGRATLDRFEQDERRHPEIIEFYLLAGASDYLLRVRVSRNARLPPPTRIW